VHPSERGRGCMISTNARRGMPGQGAGAACISCLAAVGGSRGWGLRLFLLHQHEPYNLLFGLKLAR